MYQHKSIASVKAANKAAGKHFFNKDTIKFFGSRPHPYIYKGNYFIDEIDNFDRTARIFKVCMVKENGCILNDELLHPENKGFDTKKAAVKMIQELQFHREGLISYI